jgi:TonB family protein
MRGFRLGFVLFVVSAAAISGAAAQSSSIIVKPHPNFAGVVPAPTMPLQVLDTEYPLESVLAHEEGTTSLNVLIDATGKVTFAQVLKSGGAQRLDQAASRIARTKWTFRPLMKEGSAAGHAALVDVVWKLPLRPADEIYSEMTGFSVTGKNIVEPKAAAGGNRVRATDYPTASIRNGEQGEVALRLRILPDGSVGNVEVLDSSGYSRLDQSAISMVRDRFKYEPGLVDGTPAEMGFLSMISFFLSDGSLRGRRLPRFCHSRPIIGSAMRMTNSGESNDVAVSQWIHVADGAVDDVLLQTTKGWMHVSGAMLEEYKKAIRVGAGVDFDSTPPTGSLISGTRRTRPPSCWYNGELTVQGK